jgi:hypothetical protein
MKESVNGLNVYVGADEQITELLKWNYVKFQQCTVIFMYRPKFTNIPKKMYKIIFIQPLLSLWP